MAISLNLPSEVHEAFGDDLERKFLEGLLLQLMHKEHMSVGKAGLLLGLNRLEAIRWYTSHGFHHPSWDEKQIQIELAYINRSKA